MTTGPLGPFETSSDAILAVRPADGSFTGPEALSGLLEGALQGARVTLGGWDRAVLRWLAGLDVQTATAVAGWIQRARQPGNVAEDTRRLDAIRALLARFDWEHSDRQLALEAIVRIADGGRP